MPNIDAAPQSPAFATTSPDEVAHTNGVASPESNRSDSPVCPEMILAIDQGEIHFSLCLAEYDGRIVKPLFLGTAYIEPKPLATLVEDRAAGAESGARPASTTALLGMSSKL